MAYKMCIHDAYPDGHERLGSMTVQATSWFYQPGAPSYPFEGKDITYSFVW
jgi:hypothetical protein